MTLERIHLNAWGRVVKPSKRKLRERYARCCTDVIVTINGARDKRFRFFRPQVEYRNAFAHFRELGVRVHVMSWIRPDVAWIECMAGGLAELREVAPFESLLVDAEGQWSRGWPRRERPRSRRERVAKWDALAGLTTTLLDGVGIPWGATDVPMVSWGVFGGLARRASYVMPQAHEFALRTGIRRPGRLVRWTRDHWPQKLAGAHLIPHLAAYGATQTGEGLRQSIETSLELGATEIAAWTGGEFRHRGCRKVLAEYKSQIDVAEAMKDQA